jgi:hypothetical protein
VTAKVFVWDRGLERGHPECPRQDGERIRDYLERLAIHLGYMGEPRPLVREWPKPAALPPERVPGEDDGDWWDK